jgi:hypothetical protein
MNMDALQPELLDLPQEPYELLHLLQDIIVPFAEHFTSRCNRSHKFKDRTAIRSIDDEKLSWNRLTTYLWELHLFLEEYNQQGSPVSQALYTATHQVARSLESTIHGRRIQQVIKTAKPEALISNKDVSKVSIKHKYYH